MNRADVTTHDRYTVMQMLVAGRDAGSIRGANPHLTGEQLRLIYTSHGYPDQERMIRALNVLSTKINAAGDIPIAGNSTAPPVVVAAGPRPGATVKAIAALAEIPLDRIHPSPNNPRQHLGDIPDLAGSMREAGLVQPIVVQRLDTGDFQIVAGHRRHAAAVLLGWPVIPCLVRKRMLPDAELLAMLVENGQRAGLDPIEEARALRHLKATAHLSDGQLAQKVGRSQSIVSARLALLALSAEEQEQIRTGQMGLVEGVDRGRMNSGKTRPGAQGKVSAAWLSHTHGLAPRAKARCTRLAHKRNGGASVGGTACGECWESVIRADERDHLHEVSARTDMCVLCRRPHQGGTE